MSQFVLDSSVAVKWVLTEAGTPKALAFLDDVRRNIHQIIAPEVFATEVSHVLTKAERKKIIPVGDAVKHVFDILADGPYLKPFMPLLPRAIDISSQTRIALTDCLFVALAEQEGCDMLTADQKLITNLPDYPIVHLDSL